MSVTMVLQRQIALTDNHPNIMKGHNVMSSVNEPLFALDLWPTLLSIYLSHSLGDRWGTPMW